MRLSLRFAFSTFHFKKEYEVSLPNPKSIQEIIHFIKSCLHQNLNEDQTLMARKRLHECVPTMLDYSHLISSNIVLTSKLFSICSNFKFYRHDLISKMMQQVIKNHQQPSKAPNLAGMYQYLIRMWYQDQQAISKIRSTVVGHFTDPVSYDHQNIKKVVYVMQTVVLDPTLSSSEKEAIIKSLSRHMTRLADISSESWPAAVSYLFDMLHDLLLLENVPISDQFKGFFGELEKFAWRRKQHSQRFITLKDQQIRYRSMFERIFERKLQQLGYEYRDSVYVSSCEFDFIVTGSNQCSYYPLSDIDIHALEPKQPVFPMPLLKQISNGENVERLARYKPIEPVVIELNGPLHYIDTDVKLPSRITRLEESRYRKLPLFGIHRYSVINYAQWQEANHFPKVAEDFLRNAIENPTILPPHPSPCPHRWDISSLYPHSRVQARS